MNGNVKCVESSDKRSNVKCEERKKKYILENTAKNQVISYRMDGGIIRLDKSVPEETCKCDYLVLINRKENDAIIKIAERQFRERDIDLDKEIK